jgi:hypothetical protein
MSEMWLMNTRHFLKKKIEFKKGGVFTTMRVDPILDKVQNDLASERI